MPDEVPGLTVVGVRVGLFDQLLHMVFTEQVNGQVGAVAHLLHRAGLAGGAKAHLCRVAACGLGGSGHRLTNLRDGLGHLLLLGFGNHRTSS